MTSLISIDVHATQGVTVHIHQEPAGELLQGALLETASAKDNDVAHTLEWNDCVCEDAVTFEEAEKAVAKLGNGWRMPTRQELESCLDLNRHDPAVDPEMHPYVTSAWYWSSTPCAGSSAFVWAVYFGGGDVDSFRVDSFRRSVVARVRAVRSVSR